MYVLLCVVATTLIGSTIGISKRAIEINKLDYLDAPSQAPISEHRIVNEVRERSQAINELLEVLGLSVRKPVKLNLLLHVLLL